MSRLVKIFGVMAVAGFLALGARQAFAQASLSDVEGMDHSKLNHGVPGRAGAGHPAALSGSDPNVTGMDHSRLNHGVFGGKAN